MLFRSLLPAAHACAASWRTAGRPVSVASVPCSTAGSSRSASTVPGALRAARGHTGAPRHPVILCTASRHCVRAASSGRRSCPPYGQHHARCASRASRTSTARAAGSTSFDALASRSHPHGVCTIAASNWSEPSHAAARKCDSSSVSGTARKGRAHPDAASLARARCRRARARRRTRTLGTRARSPRRRAGSSRPCLARARRG